MKLKDILPRLAVRTVVGADDVDIVGVVCDSRQVRAGSLFVAVPGSTQDGARYIRDAVEKGAVAVVAPRVEDIPPGLPGVIVDDARLALARVAKVFWQDACDRLQLAGVTGTNGKTTVAYLVRDMLDRGGRAPGLISTVQYRLGSRSIPATRTTPDAPALHRLFADMVAAGCRSAAMEVSSHALDQQRVAGITFAVAIFTNLTRDHLDYHHDMETYFAAKARLFEGLGQGGKAAHAVINADDSWGQALTGRVGGDARVVTYGLAAPADVRAENLTLSARGTAFTLASPWGAAEVQVGLPGRYNVSNALAAATAGLVLGFDLRQVTESLRHAEPAPGRLQAVPTGRGFQVYVDYAHTDDALARVLETIREVVKGRILLVFGCGGNRDTSKRATMGAIAARLADHAVVTSDNPRREDPQAIIAQILEGAPQARNLEPIVDRRQAIAAALRQAQAGDIVLIAGKGHETFQEFANRTVAFDDVQVVRDCLAGREGA